MARFYQVVRPTANKKAEPVVEIKGEGTATKPASKTRNPRTKK